MKTLQYFVLILFIGLIVSCRKETEKAVFAVPVVKKISDIRSRVSVSGARLTQSDGKIYVTSHLLFYIAQESGVHIFDNHTPASPLNIAFINLEGVHDIAVKGNYLYADNFVDLLVFDISDIHAIRLVKTVEHAFSFYPSYPQTAEFYDYLEAADSTEIVVGYRLETRDRPKYDVRILMEAAFADLQSNTGGAVGTGGSYARFQINSNALYGLESYQLNVFDISDPENTVFDKNVYMTDWLGGGAFETLFKQREFLFVGSTNGMYVINASDAFNPFFVSSFSHATACDPVVVDNNTAYITVRGGNSCGAIEDQVNVIDISDIEHPSLTSTYLLNQPYGLGVRNNTLYVCTGSGGLNVFDAANPAALILKNTYPDDVTDVIPLASHLIAVGSNRIIQYSYGADFTLDPISVVNF
ncbi:MAG: hypothetical protein IPM95_01825 [Sphingobacteriales bacterium]|nr:hypothetical protein [Sphingobacteriales bacterium]